MVTAPGARRPPEGSEAAARLVLPRRDTAIHFVGIGGVGMSGIAEVLANLGYRVSGTDLKESETTRRLTQLGCRCSLGHRAEAVHGADVVVISSAVPPTNPEVVEARRHGTPVIARAEMLAELMRMKYGVAVAGSHGKTTTTSMVAAVLHAAGLDPTAVIGGKVNALGAHARLGEGDLLVAEADESDGSFLKLTPTVAVVTNIDPEHLDHYGDVAALERAFIDFINKVPFFGLAVLCLDHPTIQGLLPQIEKRHATYGLASQADYRARELSFDGMTSRFVAVHRGEVLGPVEVRMPGAHNVLNALAVLAVSDFLGIPFDVYRRALAEFSGVQRRFTVRGEERGVLVVDDYGHHPAEVRATLAAARAAFPSRRLVVAFQPHRYSRTRDLLEEFSRSFYDADCLLLTEVYAAGEEPIAGADGAALFEAVRRHGHRHAQLVPARAALVEALLARHGATGGLRPGDLVLTLGAGDVWHVGEDLLTHLRSDGGGGLPPAAGGAEGGP
jgi:UDP-N-acetylmuramate--alanine ligase